MKAPETVAVVAGQESLTYADLETRATQLAAHLVASGVGRGSLVAVYMQRTADVMASLLGVMKSGAAYTVVEDDGLHAENYNRLLAINADLVICEPAQAPPLHQRGIRTATLAEARNSGADAIALPAIMADDVAYVLFTSGSTGKPKGVSVTHGNVAHYTAAIAEALAVDVPLRYAHVSTLAADLGNTSLLLSLSTGGCLHLISAQLRKDPAALRDYLIGNDIEFIKITPTHWNAIFSSLGSGGMEGLRLRYLVLGGEALTVALARSILQSGTVQVLANHYGPTETTVGVTTYPILSVEHLDDIKSECVPIGRPLGDTILCVRDDAGAFAIRGGSGELYIGGPSVALGYLNDEEATRQAFMTIDSPRSDAGRFYKTGDYVSIDENGVVLFLGRVDRQVKVNGYRVELEHVENVLRTVPGVDEGAVYFMDAFGKRRLVAAVLARNEGIATDVIKRKLEELLPDYMVPKVFVPMPAFPRNANGKVDMKALQAELVLELVRVADKAASNDGNPAAAGLAAEIRAMWGQYLHGVSFGDDESFFDIGGDSLDAIQLIAELQLKGHQITAHAFLNEPTVDGLVRAINARASQARPTVRKATSEYSRNFSAAQDFFLRSQLDESDHYNQALLLECGKKVDIGLMNKAVTQILTGHPSLRTAYGRDDQGNYARLVADIPDDALEVTFIARESDDEAVGKRIETVSQAVQQSLSLVDGQLFKARLFKFDTKPDQLLLVAHHIAIDVISWRVLVSELSRLYGDFSAGLSASLPDNDSTFLDWVEHVDQHQSLLEENAQHWLPQTLAKASDHAPDRDDSNTEGRAQTLWLGFTHEETSLINSHSSAKGATHLHILLLSLFTHALARQRDVQQLAVDVESHGRATFGDDIDISRVVGWHTSTYPIFVDVDSGSLAATIANVAATTHAVTDLGTAYGVTLK
ncbi:MAG: amino acid adenylation domain-containing protein, partial [Lysobacter sp.]